ncbi:MAG: peptidase T [Firmicutes bacterium]|nr:peptidase T [Bacillota bacterium]
MDIEKRFLSYVAFDTTSDENSETCPSTAKQLKLAEFITEELKALGLKGVRMDKHGYVYAYLPASRGCADLPAIGFISHMDTSNAVSGANIKPKKIRYKGGDIKLSSKVTTKVSDFPALNTMVGQELIVTDGTTLLGADDKAGISEIVTAMEYLLAHPEIKHGRIAVGFTPDEEIGRGADLFDIKGFKCDFAYTVDGGLLGEMEYENFNAASAKIIVNGLNIHPGSAKNRMKNAVLMASEYIGMLPPAETPAHTEGYEGFYHVCDIAGNETQTVINIIIRDHDRAKFEDRKIFVKRAADYMNEKYGAGTVEAIVRDSYYNMREVVEPHMDIIERAMAAYRKAGVEPVISPIRGGTDGSRLSYEGLPCPNLSTGGMNFHGINELISLDAMKKMVEVIVNIAAAE